MTPQYIEGMVFETLKLVLLLSAPVLAVALVVGLAVSIFQATTQINEMTLTFVPKMLAIYGTILVLSGFFIDRLTSFTTQIFSDFSRFVH